ncbi:hypothetical protein C1645_825629 [Glomus cerebriforme]|uniref:Uncharacterized protein n=1 Tax=Glomus cerebriforme TaxID=658196 RepID=A0A397SW96_9GLOM|nr:hypothetical protein C1645_825629 [Glomus cerebriforme]
MNLIFGKIFKESELYQKTSKEAVQISKSALKFLSAKFNDGQTNVTRTNEFWATLFELQNLFYPLCGFLNKLQKDTAQLYEVLHCFAYTIKIFDNHYNLIFSSKMLKYYYKSWFGSKSTSILAELIKYKKAEDPYDMDSFNQFKSNLVDFWNSTSATPICNDENEKQERDLNKDIIQVSDDESKEDSENEDIDDNKKELIIENEAQKWNQILING